MICTSCYQSCQKVLLTRAANVLNAILRSGGRPWRGSSRAAFITSSLPCSTPAHPPICCVTNRFDANIADFSFLCVFIKYCTHLHCRFKKEVILSLVLNETLFFGAGGETSGAEPRDGGESSILPSAGGSRSSSPYRSLPSPSQ